MIEILRYLPEYYRHEMSEFLRRFGFATKVNVVEARCISKMFDDGLTPPEAATAVINMRIDAFNARNVK